MDDGESQSSEESEPSGKIIPTHFFYNKVMLCNNCGKCVRPWDKSVD